MTQTITRVKASRGLFDLGLGELWRHRELLYFLTWRDLKIRYKQTFFGAAWAVLQPLALMVVFSVFLGRLVHVPSEQVPYPVFAFAGLVPWTLFSQALTAASNSLVESPNLISKIYFPRLIMPLAAAGSFLADFLVAMVLLIGMMALYGMHPTPRAVAVPLLAAAVLTAAMAIGVWMSAINVKYRDVRYAVPFVVQVWLFATPVAYPSSVLPERWRAVYALNPMAGLVEGFRWVLLDVPPPSQMLAVSLIVSVLIFAGGLVYFRRAERAFADWV